jgi:hypothetical protein
MPDDNFRTLNKIIYTVMTEQLKLYHPFTELWVYPSDNSVGVSPIHLQLHSGQYHATVGRLIVVEPSHVRFGNVGYDNADPDLLHNLRTSAHKWAVRFIKKTYGNELLTHKAEWDKVLLLGAENVHVQ